MVITLDSCSANNKSHIGANDGQLTHYIFNYKKAMSSWLQPCVCAHLFFNVLMC